MSQMPPTYQQPQYMPPQPKQTNVAAIASLVTGILSCVPLVSVIAVITGIIGLSKAKNPAVGGRGMAIAGLILGVIGVIWTIAAGGMFIAGKHAIQNAVNSPAHALAKQFVADVASGNTTAATADCDPSIDSAKLTKVLAEAPSWGTLNDSTLFASPAMKDGSGKETALVAGVAKFANTQRTVSITVENPNTSPKISDFAFTDLSKMATSQPDTTTP